MNPIVVILITLATLPAAIVTVSELLTKLTKVSGTAAQVQAWLVSLALVFLSDVSAVTSLLNGYSPIVKIVCAALAGFIANGYFDMSFIQTLLDELGFLYKPAPTAAPSATK